MYKSIWLLLRNAFVDGYTKGIDLNFQILNN
jgi:hypothetical protein